MTREEALGNRLGQEEGNARPVALRHCGGATRHRADSRSMSRFAPNTCMTARPLRVGGPRESAVRASRHPAATHGAPSAADGHNG